LELGSLFHNFFVSNIISSKMTSSIIWDDAIDWGDDSISTIPSCEELEEVAHQSPSSANLVSSDTCATRSVTPPREMKQGRLGKRNSWFDWFEADNEASPTTNSSNSNSQKESKTADKSKQRRRDNKSDVSGQVKRSASDKGNSQCDIKTVSILKTLVPLEDEGFSAKEYKKISRRRSIQTMGNDEAGLKALQKSLTRSTKQLVKKVSKNNSGDSPEEEELHVPFPSRPRRRSAW
jgi:hypothetical protein